jgi:hypothetical protein
MVDQLVGAGKPVKLQHTHAFGHSFLRKQGLISLSVVQDPSICVKGNPVHSPPEKEAKY